MAEKEVSMLELAQRLLYHGGCGVRKDYGTRMVSGGTYFVEPLTMREARLFRSLPTFTNAGAEVYGFHA